MEQSPIRIYLDSSDYSRFADIGYGADTATSEILGFLKEKKAQGLIEIRFSAIHLFEFLKDPAQRALALRKVQVIEDLCGNLAFRYMSDVFDKEREMLGSGADLRQLVSSDDGEWFPAAADHAIERDVLVRGLAEKLPMLTHAQIEAILPQAAAYAKEHFSKLFPLAGVYESDLVDRFLAGQATGRELAKELAKGIGKPRVLIDHYLEGNTHAQALFRNLGDSERTLHENLVRSRELMRGHVQRLLRLGRDIKEIKRTLRAYSMNFSAPYLGLDQLPETIRVSVGRARYLHELPAISTHCNVMAAYFLDIMSPSPVMPEIKESDGADILHATYLPYVDLYRTDSRFSSLVEKIRKPLTVRVVSKLRQLPQAIDQQLAQRAM